MHETGDSGTRTTEYAEVQQRLARGWNTWDTYSVLTQVLLPLGVGLRLGLKEYYRGTTLRTAQIGRSGVDDETVTLGPHAIDGAYTSATVAWQGVEIVVQTAHVGEDLVILVEPTANQQKSAVLFGSVAFLWNRAGEVHLRGETIIARAGTGDEVEFHATSASVEDPYIDVDGPRFAMELRGAVGVSTGIPRSIAEIQAVVDAAREAAAAELQCFEATTHAEVVRDAVAWNTLYEPIDGRVVTTVSRLWNVQKRGGFAMFCWDAFFGALLAGVHSKDLAHANALEMLRELTPAGFVPNVSQGTGRKTFDGSQPPVGSLVCWQLFTTFREEWFLREAFPALLRWNRWWWRARRVGDLLCAGSNVFVPEVPSPQDIPRIGQHFGATCETGLDGHPVFSDVPFDEESGLLRAFDIGLNSEYVADCEALADIAAVLGAMDERAELLERAAVVRDAVRSTLWDATAGIYRSHRTESTAPTAFLAPTSFYPMFAGIATSSQVAEMTGRHLLDPDGFGGRWAIPSFPRRELHDDVNPYWKDRAWPPMNFLVYIGLLRNGVSARTWLAEECSSMVLGEWAEHRHVHENYSSRTGAGCDVANSQPYLTWGALLSLVALIERRDVGYFAEWRAETSGTGIITNEAHRISSEPPDHVRHQITFATRSREYNDVCQ
ncbi:MGH1-like glycoside hydrolase domain-containing protein [Agromyces laixinhei]|uniref:MGH1-like glycoside hydrolase domain-containing protein n=1 Tax=Agromyces laixinhei TaxID=2585717 RepID=UPI0012ECFD0F|nr:trehalase family glycosidase [Agromyces laixinhei]